MTTQPYQFTKGSIFHLMEPDINQEIYGLPGYLSAIPSALLNESATLFRRKYYINGSHAGFIMYMTDAAQNQEDVNNLRNAMKSAKGPGNFRNLFMYSPNGKKDGLQIIPLSEVAAKDEFLNIKNVSRDDMMAAHRVPPQMMGIMPNNVGGLINEAELGSACSAESAHSCLHVLPVAPDCGAVQMHDRLHQNVDVWKLGNQTWSMPLMYFRIELIKV